MLYEFSQRNSGLLNGVTYFISGIIKEADGNEFKKVIIVKESDAEMTLSTMKQVHSSHVYSVQLDKDISFKHIQNLQRNAGKEGLMNNLCPVTIARGKGEFIRTGPFRTPTKLMNQNPQTVESINNFSYKRGRQLSIKDFCSNMDQSKKQKLDPQENEETRLSKSLLDTAVSEGKGLQFDKNPDIRKLTPNSNQTDLLIERHRPTNSNSIVGQHNNISKLKAWLQNWGKKSSALLKCAVISGPPGVGKSLAAHIVCQETGFDIVEVNASDNRNEKSMEVNIQNTLHTTTLASMMCKTNLDNSVSSRRIFLIDEVDCLIGNEDRGGLSKLIDSIKTTKVPVIAICNDRNNQRIRYLVNNSLDLKFTKPNLDQIKVAIMPICQKEKIMISSDTLDELIRGCDHDLRLIINSLSMIKAGNDKSKLVSIESVQARKEVENIRKTSIKMGPWEVCKKVFSKQSQRGSSIDDKADLYFHNNNLSAFFVQENYLRYKPDAAFGNNVKEMELLSKCADSISEGELVETCVKTGMNWELLPTAAVFCSVLPGEYMAGFASGQLTFPSWLGKNSKRMKVDHTWQEIQNHTSLCTRTSKKNIVLEYSEVLRDHIIAPIVAHGNCGVNQAVSKLREYSLEKADLDSLIEVTQWVEGKPSMWKKVNSKTKAAFTRKCKTVGTAWPNMVSDDKIAQTESRKETYIKEEAIGNNEPIIP